MCVRACVRTCVGVCGCACEDGGGKACARTPHVRQSCVLMSVLDFVTAVAVKSLSPPADVITTNGGEGYIKDIDHDLMQL